MQTLSNAFKAEYDSTKTCPHLGIRDDPETRYAYSSRAHRCFGVNPPEPIQLKFQEDFCLRSDHAQCIVFEKDWKGPLPPDIALVQANSLAGRRWRSAIWVIAIFGFLGFVWLAAVLGRSEAVGKVMPTAQADVPSLSISAGDEPIPPTSTVGVTDTGKTPLHPTRTSPPSTATATVQPTRTSRPTMTFTPQPTPGPSLGTPFGVDQIYVIYRIQAGQSLSRIAELFDTSPEAIQAANLFLPGRTLWPGDILVIPVGQDDPGQVIRFSAQFIGQKISVEELAGQYGVTVEDLRAYNLLGADEWIPAGRWLIIPVPDQGD